MKLAKDFKCLTAGQQETLRRIADYGSSEDGVYDLVSELAGNLTLMEEELSREWARIAKIRLKALVQANLILDIVHEIAYTGTD